ncbi:unnamed protein product [Spirodela intermedia]|uniref:Uncharacterized protein n=1 Tax=Spirodela intermedia TaxID=51605 RepID=A0A7I8JNT1_SPIIN|nr:unnamed protein product [Spirodela intermedia]CAA6671233.1 unnamed protein product [Spirodela intermedia]
MGSLDANCIASPRGFSPLDIDDFRQQAHQTIEFICEYYKGIESHPVVPRWSPAISAVSSPSPPPPSPCHHPPGMTHWTNPNFFAYFPATLSSAALCGDLLASALNPVAFNWLSSPAVTELESLTLDWLAQLIRLPKGFLFSAGGGGVLQATTSEAVLCTLVAARKMVLERAGHDGADKLVVYASDQTHSTFAKACKIADLFSLRPDSLRAAMEADAAAGLLPVYVCATVGTTSSTAVDRWPSWPRWPAASAPGCTSTRRTRAAPASAPSSATIWTGRPGRLHQHEPHKWLLTGLDCCCLWVRDRPRLTTSLSTDPEYLKNRATESGLVVDYKDWQIGTGRRFRALKLFMVMRCYGTANLQSHIRSDVRMARGFEEMVAADTRFEVVVPRRFALVCFRMRPRRAGADGEAEADAANRRLLEEVTNSGRIYATHTVIGGIYVIRFAVGTTLTEERHVKAAWELFRAKADAAWEAAR